MSIVVKINTVDKTSEVVKDSLNVQLNINDLVDTASFKIKKYGDKTTTPEFNDDIEIKDGDDTIFTGKILSVTQEPLTNAEGVLYNIKCVDNTWELDKLLVSETYEDKTVEYIISDLISEYAPTFTTDNVESTFLIDKIVFNQIPISECLKRLADILKYNYYIGVNKDVHLFPKNSESAPFKITDDNTDSDYGKYIVGSLRINSDGSQIANRVKVRGGEYSGDTFTDEITVNGNDTKSFNVPYRFTNLTVELNTGSGFVSQVVGLDNIDDFTDKDVLYNYQEKTFKFESALDDSDIVKYSGNPKIPVLAIAEDSASVIKYGKIEKIIKDTSIEDLDIARSRARAELLSYADSIVDAKARTLESGLRAGQSIKVYNERFDIDEDMIIKTITFRQYGHDTFQYSLDLVSTERYTLIELLQSLLRPEPMQANDDEVNEEIRTDNQNIKVLEELVVVTPVSDEVNIEVDESYYTSPTERTWVLGYYVPTSQSDIKRMGKLNRSLKLY